MLIFPKRKRPWGAGVFGRLSQLGGSSIYSRGDFGGWLNRRVNSGKSLADHGRVRTGYRHRLASLDDPRGLGVVVRIGTSGDAEACHCDTRHKRNDHDLEVGRAIGAVDRIVHGSL